MSPSLAPDAPAVLTDVASRVEARLDAFLGEEQRRWGAHEPDLGVLVARVRRFVTGGGKRLRPAFCHWGWVGAGGSPDDDGVATVGAAFELLHGFALLHDDVMDGSETRRGEPALHRLLDDEHRAQRWRGEPRRFGEGLAILAGDLAYAYANLLLAGASPATTAVWHELQIELTMGQYLDVVGAARGDRDVRLAQQVALLKSGRYTVERPLQVGAALAGRLDDLGAHYAAFGGPLGEAFQLRDDLLGVFGDPTSLGKPVGDDLREGKATLLLAAAERLATAAGRLVLRQVGDPGLDDAAIAAIQDVLTDCGARASVERAVEKRVARSLDALERAPIEPAATDALRQLAVYAAWRDR